MSTNLNKTVKSLKEKSKELYEVEIEDEIYEFSVDTVLKYRLVKGKEIEDLAEVIDYNTRVLYLNKIRNYVIKYPKSEYNLRFNLTNKYPDLDVDFIIDILKKEGLIDDYKYASSKVYTLAKKGYAKDYICNYLEYKEHINTDIISSLNITNNMDDLNKLISKLFNKYQKLSTEDKQRKIFNYLIGKGYKYNEIKTILANWQ